MENLVDPLHLVALTRYKFGCRISTKKTGISGHTVPMCCLPDSFGTGFFSQVDKGEYGQQKSRALCVLLLCDVLGAFWGLRCYDFF